MSYENKIVCIGFLKKRKQVVSTLFALIKNEQWQKLPKIANKPSLGFMRNTQTPGIFSQNPWKTANPWKKFPENLKCTFSFPKNLKRNISSCIFYLFCFPCSCFVMSCYHKPKIENETFDYRSKTQPEVAKRKKRTKMRIRSC